MKSRLKILGFSALLTMICWGCDITSPTSPSNPPRPIPRAPITIADIILETNGHRTMNGLSPLIENQKLNLAADFKMRDMFTRQYFSHYAPDGTSGIAELLLRFDYSYAAAGENIALGNFNNASELLAAWMASPGHRANILNNAYREIGVGAGYDVFEGRRTTIVVQIFGTPR